MVLVAALKVSVFLAKVQESAGSGPTVALEFLLRARRLDARSLLAVALKLPMAPVLFVVVVFSAVDLELTMAVN